MNRIKALLRSRTIKGIIAAAIGGVISQAQALLTPELLGQYGPLISAASGLLQAGGLGTAIYGRINASGPLTQADKLIS